MWYYIVNQKVVGPVSLEEIINLINAGVIVKTTCLWQSGQVRQTAGQVPELVPFLQQEPLPRPEPTPRPVPKTVSVPPMTRQRQVPRSQPVQTRQQPQPRTSRPKPTVPPIEETESTGSKVGFVFQIIFSIIVIIFSFLSFLCTLAYWSTFEEMLVDTMHNGIYAIIDINDPSLVGLTTATIVLSVLSVLVCIPIFIIGHVRKKYRIAVICLLFALMPLGYYFSISVPEKNKLNNLEQNLCTIPYYNDVVELRKVLYNDNIWDIAKNGVFEGHRYPERVKEQANVAVKKYIMLDEYNRITMQMVINGANPQEIESRCKYVKVKAIQIYQDFSDVYKKSRIDN